MQIFGESPKQWDEELAFDYELRFEKEPDDETVGALAKAWHEHCARSPARPGRWLFSKEFAYLTAFPTGDHRKCFAHVAKFIRRVDRELCPLKEAVHLTAAEDYEGLDAGPDVANSQRPVDGGYPALAQRESFDAVVRSIVEAKRHAQYGKLVAAPKAGKLGLAYCDPVPGIVDDDVSPALRALYPSDDGMRFSGSADRPRRIPKGNAAFFPSAYVCIAGEPTVIPLSDGATTKRLSCPHPSGQSIADTASRGRSHFVIIIDAKSGELREVWSADDGEELRACAWLTGSHLAVLTSKRVAVLDTKAEEGGKLLASSSGGTFMMLACQGGRLLWLGNHKFLAWNGAKLSPVGAFKIDRLYFVNEVGDRVIVRHGQDALQAKEADQHFELTELADVLAKKATPKASKKK